MRKDQPGWREAAKETAPRARSSRGPSVVDGIRPLSTKNTLTPSWPASQSHALSCMWTLMTMSTLDARSPSRLSDSTCEPDYDGHDTGVARTRSCHGQQVDTDATPSSRSLVLLVQSRDALTGLDDEGLGQARARAPRLRCRPGTARPPSARDRSLVVDQESSIGSVLWSA